MIAVVEKVASQHLPFRVDVVEEGVRERKGTVRCAIDENLSFSTVGMESYFFARWEPVLYDALLLAAAVEFCDLTKLRPTQTWGRELRLCVPVHEPTRWQRKGVSESLHELLDFLTGDRWQVSFRNRQWMQASPRQGLFNLESDISAVIPFSDGLDSRAAAGIANQELGRALVRVRLGSKTAACNGWDHQRQPFTSIPYKVRSGERRFRDSTARSRGLKFALVSGLAAYLSNAERILMPESGQGALGPALVTVGQSYPDYRSHPLFTRRMEQFLSSLLGFSVSYEFPHLWSTKAETLAHYISGCGGGATSWLDTRSCWQQNRQIGVGGKARQCGICAACMLRRLAVYAAGANEPRDTYVWEDLTGTSFKAAATTAFDRKKVTRAMHQYAIAGVLFLDHLAGLQDSPSNAQMVERTATQLSRALDMPNFEASRKLNRLLTQHKSEWESYMDSLGSSSFVANWAVRGQR